MLQIQCDCGSKSGKKKKKKHPIIPLWSQLRATSHILSEKQDVPHFFPSWNSEIEEKWTEAVREQDDCRGQVQVQLRTIYNDYI